VKRLASEVKHRRQRTLRQTEDPNFIGFDKYRRHGAYHWRELEHNPEYLGKVRLLEERLQPSDRAVDLGCGDAAYVSRLAGTCTAVVGVDADFDAVRVGSEQLAASGISNARTLQLPLSKVDLSSLGESEPFDLVYSMDVIEHLPRPEELLEVARRVVRPGGTVVVGTPLYIRDDLVSPYHVKEFTQEEIASIIRSELPLTEEVVLPGKRLDGEYYEQSFYVGISRVP
jgi:2-polyprenyl-3-methyl-5-hydroxy-6-metoxy-1,4-benzoquinol methylase